MLAELGGKAVSSKKCVAGVEKQRKGDNLSWRAESRQEMTVASTELEAVEMV